MVARVDEASFILLLTELAHEYPPKLVEVQLADRPRIAFELALVPHRAGEAIRICDVGGGLGLFSVACAALGWNSVLIDDFGKSAHEQYDESCFAPHRRHGVEVMRLDILEDNLPLAPGSLDVVTCFDTMEHLHHSPKKLFHMLVSALKPGGTFVLSAPNCVNLRKRLTVPLGYGKWSRMADWYEAEYFRSHVREPDVDDLRYIARDLGLANVRILGRNWMTHTSSRRLVRGLGRAMDILLRPWPSLCPNLYLLANKPFESAVSSSS